MYVRIIILVRLIKSYVNAAHLLVWIAGFYSLNLFEKFGKLAAPIEGSFLHRLASVNAVLIINRT